MADIVISGDSSGSVTLRAPAVSGTTVLTLPTTSGTIVTTAGAASLTTSGNLTFTGTGNRIIGDFSNATLSNRVGFQASTTNTNTVVQAIPNGTNQTSGWLAYGSSDPNNSSYALIADTVGQVTFRAAISGTGTYEPMTFFTGNSERLRIDTSGNVGIGTSTPATILTVYRNTAGSNPIGSISNSALRIQTDANEFSEKGEIQFQAGTVAANSGEVFAAISSLYTTFNGANDSGGALLFSTRQSTAAGGLTERMRIDSAGNVGIGTNSPAVRLHVQQAVATGASTTGTNQFYVENNGAVGISLITPTANQATIRHSTALDQISSSIVFDGASRFMAFTTVNGTERMRITNNGDLLLGATSNPNSDRVIVAQPTANLWSRRVNCNNYGDVFVMSAASGIASYYVTSNGTFAGQITVSGNTTNYTSGSDYRLKENITPMTGALAKVAQLKPVTYKWKNDGSDGQGFIAHELQAVVPDAVTGEKDAVDEEGNPKYQGVDTSFLVATLTAAIQELNAKVTALEKQLGAK
jgi:hypothetical protein